MTEDSAPELLAEDHVASGVLEAIDSVTEAVRAGADLQLERELVDLRHAAFAELAPTSPVAVEPVPPAPHPGGDLPEIAADDLTVDVIRDGMASYGCVLVRGLLDAASVAILREGVDRTLSAYDDHVAGAATPETAPYFTPFRPDPAGNYRIGGRKFMRESGGIWAVDSPRMLFTLTEMIHDHGVSELISGYLGERPVLSANKCNLRRVPVDTATNWHQDGAFLGREIKSLNLWLALGECGVDAPGLDIVPRRIDDIVAAGTPGAMFDWSVAPDQVDAAAGDVEIVRPRFGAGDALLFDHLFLHRTGVSPGMTVERHAIEMWFFTPSSFPEGQIPIVF